VSLHLRLRFPYFSFRDIATRIFDLYVSQLVMQVAYSYFFCDEDMFIIEIEEYVTVSFVLVKEVALTDLACTNSNSTSLSESTRM